jgi:alpha-beta hydrolase superfamily lysophospholipase
MSLDPVALEGARYSERFLEVEPGVELLLRCWEPSEPELGWPVVFVPGWISLPQGWTSLLQGLARRQPVLYVETREKATARYGRAFSPADQTIERNAADLVAVSRLLPGDPAQRVWVAASLGATILMPALASGELPARAAFLISPQAHFHYPWWVRPITYTPDWLYPPVRDFVLWYLRTFAVDAEREPQQMARYERTMHAAEPRRLKFSARSFDGYAVWPLLDRVRLPVGVAHAASDTLHAADDVLRLIAGLPSAVDVPCPSNLYMHRADLIADLDRFLAGHE